MEHSLAVVVGSFGTAGACAGRGTSAQAPLELSAAAGTAQALEDEVAGLCAHHGLPARECGLVRTFGRAASRRLQDQASEDAQKATPLYCFATHTGTGAINRASFASHRLQCNRALERWPI